MKVASKLRAQKPRKDAVLDAAKKAYESWTNGTPWTYTNADDIYDEVNRLKHGPEGLQQRKAEFTKALAAVEEVLDLLEEWRKAGCPK